jgi:arylsulfatase A-like enzyme
MRPNIVMLLIDDLGARDLGGYGSSFYETPNLDRLAERGVRFDRAYASAPVCSPTRCSIMTGKYPARVGVTQWIGDASRGKLLNVPYLHYLPHTETSLATALREGGYQTWHVGKWHLGDEAFFPERHGFDVNIAGRHLGHPPGPNGFWGPYNIPGFTGPAGEYLTDRHTADAIALIDKRDTSRPFFLNLWHYAVHTPIQAPADLVEKYRDKARRLKLDQLRPLVKGERVDIQLLPGKQPPHVMRRIVQSDPAYAAMIENLDTNIGLLVAALERNGILDDTVIAFTSDNGGLSTAEGAPTCNHPLAEGKGWCYEGGNRVCQIVAWPGTIPGGQTCHEPVTSTDFYPTFLDLAGLPARPRQHRDGVSLLPLLNGSASMLDRESLFWHYPHYSNQGGRPGAAIVCRDWKLIWHFEDDRIELFNIADDVSEAHDVSAEHPDFVRQLKQSLLDWQTQVSAERPKPNPAWQAWVESLERPTEPNNAHK